LRKGRPVKPRPILRLIWAAHRLQFRMSGGRLGTRRAGAGLGTLFIETTSRRTGEPKRNPLFYLEDGAGLVVAASNAGADRDPAWWRNLQADPRASVLIEGRRRDVRARSATADEARRLWPRFDTALADYAAYRARASRSIAIVMLEPRSPET